MQKVIKQQRKLLEHYQDLIKKRPELKGAYLPVIEKTKRVIADLES